MKSKSKNMSDNNKDVKSINKNIRSSVRKLNPILKSLVGKKVEIAIRNLSFSEKRVTKDTISKKISFLFCNKNKYSISNICKEKFSALL